MKKVIFFLAAVCMMAVTMISFTSCDNEEGGKAPSVVGTWVGKVKTSYTIINGVEKANYADCTFTFTKDKATITVGDKEPVEYTYKKTGPLLAGDTPYLTFYYEGKEAGSLHYEVNGETLNFIGSGGDMWGLKYVGTYTKKK